MGISFKPYLKPLPGKEPEAPTAVLIAKSYDGLAVHSLLNISRLFANYFKNIVVVSVGVVNTNTFSAAEVQNLQRSKEENLKSLVQYANGLGWHVEYRYSVGVGLLDELEKLCKSIAREFPNVVFFTGKLISEKENFLSRLLHKQTAYTLQRRLKSEGLSLLILPVSIFDTIHFRDERFQ